MTRWLVRGLVTLGVGAVAVVLGGADGRTPGVTETEIKIGNTMPYSGPASAFGAAGHAMAAYFKKVNATGGIGGRKIDFISHDDGYSPPKTVEQVRRLVEQDQVLLIFGSVGTATNAAVQKYLNEKKVPQLFIFSGTKRWNDPKSYPWSMPFIPASFFEGQIYAKHVLATVAEPRIGVLYQNDDYGKEYLSGFKHGLGARSGLIVTEQSYDVSAPTLDSQLANLKASGANVFADFSTPKFAAQAIRRVADLGWHPVHVLSMPGSQIGSVMIPAGPQNGIGIVTANYRKDALDPNFAADPAVLEWEAWMKEYNPQESPLEGNSYTGYSAAQLMVKVLEQCGNDLSRENVMRQAANLRDVELPLLLPGVKINTSPTNYAPISQLQLQRFDGRRWVPFGPILNAE